MRPSFQVVVTFVCALPLAIAQDFRELGYVVFARYRVPLGRLFGRKCAGGSCAVR